MKTHYEILGVSQNSSLGEIKNAFRKKAKIYHSDKLGDDSYFKLLVDSYSVLSDRRKRENYDRKLKSRNSGLLLDALIPLPQIKLNPFFNQNILPNDNISGKSFTGKTKKFHSQNINGNIIQTEVSSIMKNGKTYTKTKKTKIDKNGNEESKTYLSYEKNGEEITKRIK
jgi:curved DNA-binding protein CbpA